MVKFIFLKHTHMQTAKWTSVYRFLANAIFYKETELCLKMQVL